MSILFKPSGSLDITTDPTSLPDDGMARIKNLSIDRMGMAELRKGSSRVNSTALSGAKQWLLVENGVRYSQFGTTIYRNETSIKTGVTGAQGSAVRYKSFNESTRNIFYTNGSDQYRIAGSSVYQWGISAPTAAPTASTAGTSTLAGTYGYKYTYARQSGSTVISESNPSSAVSIAAEEKTITVNWTASSDSQVTHVRLYRTLSDGSIYYFLTSVAIGTTSYDDTTVDGDLGDEVETDHDLPPSTGTIVVGPAYNGLLFMADGNDLYWCSSKQAEYWPTANNIELAGPDEPILAMCLYDGQLYVWSKYRAWYIQGTGTGVFHPIPLPVMVGAQNIHGVLPVAGRGIFHTGPDGIYQYVGGNDRKISDIALRPAFEGSTVGGIPGVSTMSDTWLALDSNKLWFHYNSGSAFVLNLDTNRLVYHEYDEELYQPAIDEANDRFLCLDASGYIRQLENASAIQDAGTDISWEIETKQFTLQTRAHFPRWIKYDIDASDYRSSSVSGTIRLDDALHQTHAIVDSSGVRVASYNRNAKRRLITIGNGERCSIRLNGTGPTTIYALEME